MSVNQEDKAGELLIQEVDEDLRREQYLKLWQLYGKYAIAGVIAIVLGVAGHQVWLTWRDRQFQTDAAAYQAAETLLTAGKTSEGVAKLDQIAAGKDGFAMLAAFRRAEVQAASGDDAAAIAGYEALSHSGAPAEFRELAIIKEAMLALDKDDPDALAKKLQPLAEGGKPWRFTANELLAALANRRGDKAMALAIFRKLAEDAAAPQAIRARAAGMVTVLGGGQTAAPEKE